MNQTIYNVKMIIVALFLLAFILIIIPNEYNKIAEKGQIVVRIVCIIIAISLFVFMICCLDYTGKVCQIGQITEIKHLGSYGGFYDRYEIVVFDEFGKKHSYMSAFTKSKTYVNYMNGFFIGDTVKVYGSTLFDACFYKLEKC